MNSTKILSVNNLFKSYYTDKEEIKVLNDISFDVNNEDFIGIVGPSGCGKSSILNILSGLDNNYFGNIEKNNLKIGYMFQQDLLFPWLTIYENATLGLKIRKELNNSSKKYVLNLLNKYGLLDFKNNYPDTLSGGMKQRLSLIRTLAIKPDILLLDEPFSALDYQTRLLVCDDIYKIIKQEKKTAIMVTHDIEEAVTMCNKIIVLSKRPSIIKRIYSINVEEKNLPTQNRQNEEFKKYYSLIWKDIDK